MSSAYYEYPHQRVLRQKTSWSVRIEESLWRRQDLSV